MMNLRGTVGLFFASILIAASLVSVFCPRVSGVAGLGVHNLDTGLSYSSIQEAINANETLDGHTILVDAGSYRENVAIFKSVSLVASEGFGTVVDGGGLGNVISIRADNVNVTGFVIQNGGMQFDNHGIFLNNVSECVLDNNIVRGSYYGGYLYYSDDNFLSNNTFSDCGYGVWLAYSQKNLLLRNRAFNNTHVGFHLFPSSGNVLDENEAWNNENGIYVYFSRDNELIGNRVFNNTFGIWFAGCANSSVSKNEAYNNTYGLRLAASSKNSITDNLVHDNGLGILLRDGSNDSQIFHNNFFNNTLQAESLDSKNTFSNGMEGNYWSDYAGLDENNDGIGDTPYTIEDNETDLYPLMGRFYGFVAVLEKEYPIEVISNCSVSGFEFSPEAQTLRFSVSSLNTTSCFYRIMFPVLVIASPYTVIVDGVEVSPVFLHDSNVSHAFLYFVYKMSSQQVVIASRSFYVLQNAYSSLLANYTQLLANYTALNSSYKSLLDNYTQLQKDFSSLQSDLNSLQSAYDALNSTYNALVVSTDSVKAELGSFRLLMYVFLASTFGGLALFLGTLRFGFGYYRKFNEQKRIVEAYGLSPLEVAGALLELDIKKRGEKIEKFQEKYGYKIRPRGSLEEIIKSLKSKKERQG
jgi:nitrous oxidase accessory protein